MSSVQKKSRVRKPLQPVGPVPFAWILKPIWPCDLFPEGKAGWLVLRGVVYRLRPLVPGGYELMNLSNDKIYHLDTSAEPWKCSCGDFIFRREQLDPAGCKHCVGVLAALKQLWEGGDVQR